MPGSFYTTHGAAANLIGNVVYYTLYVLYLCLFATTMSVLRSKRAKMSPAIGVIVALFVLSLLLSVVGLVQLYRAFVTYPGGPDEYYYFSNRFALDPSLVIISDFCFAIGTIMADALLAWRLWIVWDRNPFVLILPATSYLIVIPGSLVVCSYTIFFAIKGFTNHQSHIFKVLVYLGLSNTIALCFYNTGMTCGRLWFMRKELLKFDNTRPNPYLKIMTVSIESGILYSLSVLCLSVFYVVHGSSLALFLGTIFVNVCSMMIFIAPTLVMLRLALGHLHPSDSTNCFSMSALQKPSNAERGALPDPNGDDDNIWATATNASIGFGRDYEEERRKKARAAARHVISLIDSIAEIPEGRPSADDVSSGTGDLEPEFDSDGNFARELERNWTAAPAADEAGTLV